MNDKTSAVVLERRQRLSDLIERHAHGNTAKFARDRGLNQSLLSRYVKTRGHAAAEPIGWIAARNLERRLGLNEGYLDGSFWAGKQSECMESDIKSTENVLSEMSVQQWIGRMAELVRHVAPDRKDIVIELFKECVLQPGNPVFQRLLLEELLRART